MNGEERKASRRQLRKILANDLAPQRSFAHLDVVPSFCLPPAERCLGDSPESALSQTI